jgi:hypothetical protein
MGNYAALILNCVMLSDFSLPKNWRSANLDNVKNVRETKTRNDYVFKNLSGFSLKRITIV